MREFRISDIDIERTLAKANQIASRASKNGLSGGFTCSIQDRFETIDGVEFAYKVLVIEGTQIQYEGWKFVGVVEFIEGKPLFKTLPNEIDFSNVDIKIGWCDHCKTKRNRSQIIIVQDESGKLSQVGSTCVKDFLGWQFNPSWLVTEEDFAEAFETGFTGFSGVSTVTALGWGLFAVDELGYISPGNGVSTRELVWGKLMGGYHGANVWKYYFENKAQSAPSDDYFEKAKELLEWGKTFEGESAYASNVRLVCGLEYQKPSTIGILISIIKAKQNQIAKEVEEKITYKSEQFAPTGEKVEIAVKVLNENTFETTYGLTTLYTFTDGEYQFKWFSSRGLNVEIGDEIKIKGTVKGSDEYKGTFSTLLTRCKVA